MGTFSKFLRYRERGQEANTVNVERFGTPSHSLFISTNFWSFRQKTKIMEEDGSIAYRAKSRSISLHDKTDITNANGKHVAHIERKVLTLRKVHWITMADGTKYAIDIYQPKYEPEVVAVLVALQHGVRDDENGSI